MPSRTTKRRRQAGHSSSWGNNPRLRSHGAEPTAVSSAWLPCKTVSPDSALVTHGDAPVDETEGPCAGQITPGQLEPAAVAVRCPAACEQRKKRISVASAT